MGFIEEVEFKLAIVGSEPPRTMEAIAGLERLHRFRLGRLKRHLIHDVYWDTPGHILGTHGVRLRLREIDGDLRFTVKARATSDRGLFRRREQELPATRENWARVRDAIAHSGVALDAGSTSSSDPAGWVRTAGLVETQDRTTQRRLLPVHEGTRCVAQIALDCVVYRFGERRAEFWEIEIEPVAGSAETACMIGERLLALFPDRLEPSTMGKYRRGLMLERLLLHGPPGCP